MHPLLAHYLNLEAAVDTLQRADSKQVLKAEERPYAEAARALPEERARVLAARGLNHPPEETQRALVRLAAHGALRALAEEAVISAKLQSARDALLEAGGDEEEADGFLAAIVA